MIAQSNMKAINVGLVLGPVGLQGGLFREGAVID